MRNIIEVETGEVKAGNKDIILKSNAIGSCVVISAYDLRKKVGAMAHIMLPGRSPSEDNPEKTRYAADAINDMIDRLVRLGGNREDIEACLVGGGNVLKRDDDIIWKENIASVTEILTKKGIQIRAKALGGTNRRSVSLDIERGIVSYAEGEEEEKLLWKV